MKAKVTASILLALFGLVSSSSIAKPISAKAFTSQIPIGSKITPVNGAGVIPFQYDPLTCSMIVVQVEAKDVTFIRTYDSSSYAGMPLFSSYLMTLDTANRRLILEKRKEHDVNGHIPGEPDVILADQNGKYVIESVSSQSDAYRSGIRPDDQILQVDNHPLQGLDWMLAQTLLSGFAGTTANVTVKSGDKPPRLVRYKRESVFDGKYDPTRGVVFNLKNGVLMVSYVTTGCPAYKLGLREGDEIVQLNDQLVADLTPEYIMGGLSAQQADLIVKKAYATVVHYQLTARPDGEVNIHNLSVAPDSP